MQIYLQYFSTLHPIIWFTLLLFMPLWFILHNITYTYSNMTSFIGYRNNSVIKFLIHNVYQCTCILLYKLWPSFLNDFMYFFQVFQSFGTLYKRPLIPELRYIIYIKRPLIPELRYIIYIKRPLKMFVLFSLRK